MVHVEPRCKNGSIGLHVEGPNESSSQDAVVLNTLSYAYSGHRPIVSDISLTLPKGSRCLLLGANGAGEPLWSYAILHARLICISGHEGKALRASPSHAMLQATQTQLLHHRAAAVSCSARIMQERQFDVPHSCFAWFCTHRRHCTAL